MPPGVYYAMSPGEQLVTDALATIESRGAEDILAEMAIMEMERKEAARG
jgi:hypothetical protein